MSKTAFGIRKILSAAVAVLLLSGEVSHAENMQAGIPGLYKAERLELKHVDGYTSAQEYREVSRHNQRVFGKAARKAFEDTLMSYGISKQGVEITGAAVGLAVKGAKLGLNESKSLTLEVNDVVTKDRAISFNLKLDW